MLVPHLKCPETTLRHCIEGTFGLEYHQGENMKPEKVNIMGIEYSITYVDIPSEVDIHKRESLFGQIDYWTDTIRIYDNGRPIEDIWHSIFHELLEGFACELHLKELSKPENHDELDILALAMADTLFRNDWMKK